jgi:hypothetical protein
MQGVTNANASGEANAAPVGQFANLVRAGIARTCIKVS